ncbi:hypothetical protein WJ590_004886 [Escherichia coli]|jgi:hypothetical protein|uniref:Uncharacterized protein n=1 Tax=Escherichia coli TaxID=562 RepID=A0A7G9A9Z8_ECOLX|nr:hypothetical protein [Escherichia coli]EGQ4563203.1 hypothetical protein [Salmonella enterica]EHU4041703.1 hypothetical protein [Salmonella enterica subsp. enterica serovar Senftenberg]EGX7024229.1 hypothetical protein [Escherichia coli]EGX9039919.1 hypothetical protein [Salmonella enterica]EHL4430348.1 hypothetical protein [Salmonella enterica]
MLRILLEQQGSRISLNVDEYQLHTSNSIKHKVIVDYLVNNLSRSRGIFRAEMTDSYIFENGEYFSSEYQVCDQNADSDLLLRESIAILCIPREGSSYELKGRLFSTTISDLYFLHNNDSLVVRDRNGIVDEYP